ncbi:MAG: DUF1349 domain-containing protein [Sedimentisphaerales bacterium]|nr:DUF1349 domain-containing protein [Sedimentisphaerales bacterium]
MKWGIVVLIWGVLCFSFCQGEPANVIGDDCVCDCNCVYNPDSNMCDCNCICPELETLNVAYLFEDFNESYSLNIKCDDYDSTHVSFDKNPGAMTITTQKRKYGRYDTEYKNLFYLNFPVCQALDFQVTTCISNYEPNGIGNQAGLMLFYDEDNLFKYVYEYGKESPLDIEGKLLLSATVETDGIPESISYKTSQQSQTMWLRIIKRGDKCELYSSTDGEIFNPLKVDAPVFPVQDTNDNIISCPSFLISKIGVFANNGDSEIAPEVDASFEFLEFKVLPIDSNVPDINDIFGDIIEDENLCDCNCVYNPDSNMCDCNCVCPEPEPLPVAYLFDDFNEALDLSWTILNEDMSHWSLTKNPGSLTITTQKGSFEYSNTDYRNIFLVDFPVSQVENFQITTCISNFDLREIWNQAGLVLWRNADNYLKYVYEYGQEAPQGDGILLTIGTQISGASQFNWYLADQFPQTMWLRIIKRGDYYEIYNSIDGENFNSLQKYHSSGNYTLSCLPFPIERIGIFTSNYTSESAAHVDASFEYFEFKTLPEEPVVP